MSSMEAYLCAAARRLFRLAPIDRKKVVFCSYYGKGYSDSPKAIAEALLASGEDLKLVWLLRDPKDAAHLPEGISPASYRGDSPGLGAVHRRCLGGQLPERGAL